MGNRIQYEDDEWEDEPEEPRKRSLRDHRGGFSRNSDEEDDDESEDAN